MSKQVNADGVVENTIFGLDYYKPVPRKRVCASHTPAGEPFTIRPKLSFGDNGVKRAAPGEKFDLDGMIQAAKDSTDIAAIVARYKAGDESVLHVNPGFIGDSVTLPKDIYDVKAMNDLYDKVSGSFDKLPDDIKALFNNNVEEYLNSIIANKANEIVTNYQASQKAAEEAAEGEK